MPTQTPVSLPLSLEEGCPASSRAWIRELQHQPLLRIHRGRLGGIDREGFRSEAIDLLEIAGNETGTALAVRCSPPRHRTHGVRPPSQELLESGQIGGAGKPAGHAHDGDAFGGGGGRVSSNVASRPLLTGREIPRESVDGRVLVRESRREAPAQVLLELSGDAHRVHGAESERNEGSVDVDGARGQVALRRDLRCEKGDERAHAVGSLLRIQAGELTLRVARGDGAALDLPARRAA